MFDKNLALFLLHKKSAQRRNCGFAGDATPADTARYMVDTTQLPRISTRDSIYYISEGVKTWLAMSFFAVYSEEIERAEPYLMLLRIEIN